MKPADQPIGVLICSSLPGVVRIGEKHIHSGLALYLLMSRKFLAVIKGDAQARLRRHGSKELADLLFDLFGFLRV